MKSQTSMEEMKRSRCRSLDKQCQHAGIGEKMVGASQRRKLVAAEEADQRKIAERLADVSGVDARHAV